MSRLDDHVAAVQNRLALELFLTALAWLSAIFAAIVLVAVLVDRIFLLHPPQPVLWLYAGIAAVFAAAAGYALYRRPSPQEAAVPIDQKLGLKEKISTALYIRSSSDEFAQATLRDAETTAQSIALNLGKHFPISFPKPAYATIVIAIAAALAYALINPMDLFDRKEKQQQQLARVQEVENAREQVAKAMAFVDSVPTAVADEEAVKLAKADLAAMMQPTANDAGKMNRTAVKALQDVNAAITQKIKESAAYAEAQNESKMMRSMQKPVEGQGPVSDAHRAVADGKFTEAVEDLEKAVDNFDKMDKSDQQKAAQQMQQMAQQLQQMTNNPAQQQQMQQQLQQLGMNQQQAKQAQQLMQQTAQGNQQAQQQLQQMAQQMQQQMNNGQPANQQQAQQIQQMMQQMQANANAQQQAQQMAQAAQQMAQAMKQAAQQQQGQPQAQQGQQNQQMGQAMQQMQQQLQQMQAQAQDAQQIAAAQAAAQAAQAAAQAAMGAQGAQGQGQPGQGQWAAAQGAQGAGQQGQGQGGNAGGQGNWQGQGQGNGPAGQNNGGQAQGDRNYKQTAPYTVKPEISPSQDNESGRILASTYIKDSNPLKGSSSADLKQVAERALNQQTDEIDQERISRPAQNAEKAYFDAMLKGQ